MSKYLKLLAIKLTYPEIKGIDIKDIRTGKYKKWINGGQIHSNNTYQTICTNFSKACQWT